MPQRDPQQEAISVLSRFLHPASKDAQEAQKTRESFRFLREKQLPGRMLLAITNELRAPGQLQLCYLEQNAQGEWRYSGGASNNTGGVSAYPRVVLAGGGWPNHFYAGGYLIDNGQDIAHVRLLASNGTQIEDHVQDGLVLFLTEQPVTIPLRAELYDHNGRLREQHNALY